jgi:hypothetical protein
MVGMLMTIECAVPQCGAMPISAISDDAMDLCFDHAEIVRRRLFDRLVAAERRFAYDLDGFTFALRNYHEFMKKYLTSMYE